MKCQITAITQTFKLVAHPEGELSSPNFDVFILNACPPHNTVQPPVIMCTDTSEELVVMKDDGMVSGQAGSWDFEIREADDRSRHRPLSRPNLTWLWRLVQPKLILRMSMYRLSNGTNHPPHPGTVS
jgi:hypothetical protein